MQERESFHKHQVLSIDSLVLSPGWKYNLNVVKNIKGTENFMDLADSVKDCQKEPYDNCTTKNFVDRVIQSCKCLPLKMKTPENEKASTKNFYKVLILS